MSNASNQPAFPLQEAVLAWAAAVETVEAETRRIINGNPVDRARVAALLAAVETARLRCEHAASSLSDMKEDAH